MAFDCGHYAGQCGGVLANQAMDKGRTILEYLLWVVSSGFTSFFGFEARHKPIDALYWFTLAMMMFITTILLIVHLQSGIGDVGFFCINAIELFVCTVTLGVVLGFQAAVPQAPLLENGETGVAYPRVILPLTVGVIISLGADAMLNAFWRFCGVSEGGIGSDLVMKMMLFVFATSLPFFAIDQSINRKGEALPFLWKVWVIEAIDLVTLFYGSLDLVDAKKDDSDGWNTTLIVYYSCICFNIIGIGALTAWLIGKELCDKEFFHGFAASRYRFIVHFVAVLDGFTDVPVFFLSLYERNYVNNLGLTMNVVINLLSILRAIFILVFTETHHRFKPESSPDGAQ